jgi:hypothetical protein
MNHFKYAVSLMLVFALAVVFSGCAKPPEAEKSAAKAAMDSAVSAGAAKYAATDFEAAKKLWDTSETQMTEKKYKEAKQGYIDAKAAFEKAAGAGEAGKKAMTDEANAAVASLEKDWKNLEAAAKKIKKKMKDKKDAWTADAKTFAEGLKATKDMVAADPAGAKTKAGELKSILDKWDATLKELAAAPAKPETAKRAKKRKK